MLLLINRWVPALSMAAVQAPDSLEISSEMQMKNRKKNITTLLNNLRLVKEVLRY